MGKSIPPITEKTFLSFSNFIDEVVIRKESGSIIGLNQREQNYRLNQLKNIKSYNVIDLKSYLLDDPEDVRLHRSKNQEQIVILINNADCLFQEKFSFLTFFNNLIKKNKNISLFFIFQHNITYPWHMKLLSSYHYLFQNLFFYPKYGEPDLKQFLSYLEDKFKHKIPVKIKKIILKECESNLWIIKEAFRYFIKTNDIKKIFTHEEIIFRLQTIFNEFEDFEKQVLKKIVRQEEKFSEDEKIIINFFKKTNFISPLLKKYIFEIASKENLLSLDADKKIILNSISVDAFFSRSEKKGLRYLLSCANKLVSRYELAKTLWSGNDNYTDWALDQFMKRLRNKLKRLGLNQNSIKTIKNQGFLLNI